MTTSRNRFRTALLGATALAGGLSLALTAPAAAQERSYQLDLPAQPLAASLMAFGAGTDQQIVFTDALVRGRTAPALQGDFTADRALATLLDGTGLTARRTADGIIMVQPEGGSGPQSSGAGGDVDALIVTAQKREENIQDVPIAISAFSQEDLTTRQVAGGPDLITQIPNFSFTKTNFSSYSIQIRGIGTQAISATTDPAVAVAFNNTPFIRNRFFEQEFFDLERLEVLRGPQGTLYGRNATAGVVNLISAKPKFRYEAKASADIANYNSSRIEGMVNVPLVEDKVALRVAGAWTKRDGFATNQMTGAAIDGRDLWSTRLSLRFEPNDQVSANFIWEHFQEDDDRLRSGKQLCKKHIVKKVGNLSVPYSGGAFGVQTYLSQGCEAVSLYSDEAFQTPNGYSLPYFGPLGNIGNPIDDSVDPYLNATQSRDLRVIESSVEPDYRANSDVAELQVSIDLSDTLTLSSETAYSADSLFSMQDYNRFTTRPGVFLQTDRVNLISPSGVFCDPQLGCSDRILLVDLSTSESSQFSQEFRLASDFDGPLNFSLGVNYLRHDAEDKYFVFINTLSLYTAYNGSVPASNAFFPFLGPYQPGVTDNSLCDPAGIDLGVGVVGNLAPTPDPNGAHSLSLGGCAYMDPNPIGALNDEGRNYFLSRNPYKLISYATFGELYYNVNDDLKITAGLRFTVDRKTAPQIPSWLLVQYAAGPYPATQTLFQEWKEPTGRLAIDWKPDLSFTDETLLYASYAHGYKAGGANPPPPVLVTYALGGAGTAPALPNEILPDTFGPEFVDAFEIGTKNTLFDGAVTLNLTGFYYDYKGYQVSEIRNRSAVNSNYDAEVWGAEIEADWRVTDALRLGFKGGYEKTRIADGMKAIDLMDRTAGQPGWMVSRPFPSVPSNCIVPVEVLTAGGVVHAGQNSSFDGICIQAYYFNYDPITHLPYNPSITDYTTAPTFNGQTYGVLGSAYASYHGFDPSTAPNGGRGFDKQLGGNELPNAPNYTATVTADYTRPLSAGWTLNLHSDVHWQSKSWWRVFNDLEYDRLDAFYTMNMAAIFRNEDAGWNVMAYVKNVTDETAITGAFLNSDDTGLTTNVFLTEPRLYGIRVTKDFTGGGWLEEIGRCPEGVCPVTVEIGGGMGRATAETEAYAPAWLSLYSATFPLDQSFQDDDLSWGDTRSVKVTYAPSNAWRISAAYRFGKMKGLTKATGSEEVAGGLVDTLKYQDQLAHAVYSAAPGDNVWRAVDQDSEEHAIADFTVGKEFGFGMFSDSWLSAGLRYADLKSTSKVSMEGVPHWVIPAFAHFYVPANGPIRNAEEYNTSLDSDREFEGLGPSVGWDASLRLLGDEERGHVDLDWSVGGGVLFGKQTVDSNEERLANYFSQSLPNNYNWTRIPVRTLYDTPVPRSRSENVTVPNLSLSLGLSYTIDRVKVSTGYSYDRFFDAIDGGYKDAETYDRTIHGPYLKLSIGFGG